MGRRTVDLHRLVALGIRLLDITAMRVGNEEYAEENGAYGLTTLLPEHDRSSGRRVHFIYPAKGGGEREVLAHDRRAASLVRRCRAQSGPTLLSFRDRAGETRGLTSRDVNTYLREHDATSKTFRTWSGTVVALQHRLADPSSDPASILDAVDAAACHLGNSREVARTSYVHPAVLEASETHLQALKRQRRTRRLARAERALTALIS